MSECIFCKIVRKEIPSEFVGESSAWVAFKDIKPSAPVHVLVVPRIHIESIANLEPNHDGIVAELIFAAKNIAGKLGLKGYKLVFNVGAEGGQIIPHLHLHLLGGWSRQQDIDAMPHPGLDK